jgi:hypothetical protein
MCLYLQINIRYDKPIKVETWYVNNICTIKHQKHLQIILYIVEVIMHPHQCFFANSLMELYIVVNIPK